MWPDENKVQCHTFAHSGLQLPCVCCAESGSTGTEGTDSLVAPPCVPRLDSPRWTGWRRCTPSAFSGFHLKYIESKWMRTWRDRHTKHQLYSLSGEWRRTCSSHTQTHTHTHMHKNKRENKLYYQPIFIHSYSHDENMDNCNSIARIAFAITITILPKRHACSMYLASAYTEMNERNGLMKYENSLAHTHMHILTQKKHEDLITGEASDQLLDRLCNNTMA